MASAKRNVNAKTAITCSHSRLHDPTHFPFPRLCTRKDVSPAARLQARRPDMRRSFRYR
jgi:hypothetical protein